MLSYWSKWAIFFTIARTTSTCHGDVYVLFICECTLLITDMLSHHNKNDGNKEVQPKQSSGNIHSGRGSSVQNMYWDCIHNTLDNINTVTLKTPMAHLT